MLALTVRSKLSSAEALPESVPSEPSVRPGGRLPDATATVTVLPTTGSAVKVRVNVPPPIVAAGALLVKMGVPSLPWAGSPQQTMLPPVRTAQLCLAPAGPGHRLRIG